RARRPAPAAARRAASARRLPLPPFPRRLTMRSPILALALLATLCACGSETPAPATAGSSPSPAAEEAQPAVEDPGAVEDTAEYPAFTGTTVDGRPYDLAALR